MRRVPALLALALLLVASQPSRSHAGALGTSFLEVEQVDARLANQACWRGFDHGKFPLTANIQGALWNLDGVRDKHAIVGFLQGTFPLASRDDFDSADRLRAGAGYRYHLDTEEGELQVRFEYTRFSADGGSTDLRELVGLVQHRFPLPQMESRPLGHLLIARGLGDLDRTYGEAGLSLDLGLPAKDNGASSIGARLEATTGWSDDPARGESGDFGHQATTIRLWLIRSTSQSAIGPLNLELGFGGRWSDVAAKSARFLVELRVIRVSI